MNLSDRRQHVLAAAVAWAVISSAWSTMPTTTTTTPVPDGLLPPP